MFLSTTSKLYLFISEGFREFDSFRNIVVQLLVEFFYLDDWIAYMLQVQRIFFFFDHVKTCKTISCFMSMEDGIKLTGAECKTFEPCFVHK